jgi:hypothetical protein
VADTYTRTTVPLGGNIFFWAQPDGNDIGPCFGSDYTLGRLVVTAQKVEEGIEHVKKNFREITEETKGKGSRD